MFAKPKLFSKSRLRDAQLGNDGTKYAACAEAVADPADPFKVRGDILPAADIPALSGLIGCNVRFDTTTNEYRIVGAAQSPYAAALSSVQLPYAENISGQLVISGSYAYIVINKTILKIDTTVSPPTIVGRIYLPIAEQYSCTLLCTDGTFLYTVTDTTITDSTLYVIRISTLAIEGTVTLTGRMNLTAIAADSSNIFFCEVSGSAGKIYKYTPGPTAAPVTSVSLTGYGSTPKGFSVYTGTSDGYLYVAGEAKNAAPNPLKHYIWKINKTSMTVTTALASATSAYTAAGAANNGAGLTHYGNYLYSCFTDSAGTGGYASRVDLTTFAAIAELAFSAGEIYPAGVCTDGTSLFYYCNTSPIKIVKCSVAAFTRTSVLTLNAGENGVSGRGNIAYYSGYIFTGCTTSPAIMVRSTTANTRDSALTFLTGLIDPSYGACVSGSYAYVASAGSPSVIGKINLLTGVLEATLKLNTGENAVKALWMGLDGLLYAGCAVTPGIIVQIDPSGNMTRLAIVTLAAGEGPINSLTGDADKIYAGCGSTSGILAKVNRANLVEDGAITFSAGENDCRWIEMKSGYMYCGCYSGHVVKCDLSTFLRSDVEVTTQPVIQMAQDGTYLYIIMNNATDNIGRIDFATFTLGTVLDTAAATAPKSCCIVGSSLHVFSGTSKFDVADLTGWTILYTITSASIDAVTQAFPRMLVYNNYIWLVNGGGSGAWKYMILYQVDPFSNLTLFERLQTADIGDSFSVRAPLACAQESNSRPMIYASDGHISPRAQGTENTQLVLRCHAPNFLEDGGLESGAFSPNWTAGGANWTVVTANKLIGAYSAQCDFSTNDTLIQSVTRKLKTGKTYRLIFKADSLTAAITAGAITIALRQAGSLTPLDSTMSGSQPVITTTSEWFELEFTPAFNTNNWQLVITPNLSLKGSSTGVIIDEFYLYRKSTMNSLWVDGHNWGGKGRILVKPRRYSGLRSTAHDDAAFSRASVAYDSEGNQSLSGIPRYETGWNNKANGAIIVEEGATNLLTANQSDAGDTLGNTTGFAAWSAGTVTITRDTSTSRQGAGCIKCVTGGDAIEQGVVATKSGSVLNPSQSHSMGVWLKGAGTVYLRLTELTAALAVVGGTDSSAIVLSNTWTWYSVTRLFGATGVNAYLTVYVGSGITAAVTIYTDLWQLEEKGYATTWQLAGGAARAVETLAVPSWVVNRGNWSFSARIKPLDANGATNARRLCGYYIDANNYCILDLLSTHRLYGQIKSGGVLSGLSPTNTLPVGSWYHIEWSGDGVNQKLFLNGVQIGASTAYTEPVGIIPSFGIGSVAGTSNYGNSAFDDMLIYNRALTATEAVALYAAADPRTLSSYASCVWHQNFDSAIDSGGFEVDEADRFLKYIPTSEWPCVELTLPAVASWTPEAGEIYIGDYWQLPGFCKGPLDPYRTNADGLIDQTWRITNINPALRTTTIEDLFDALRSGEAILSQWDSNAPIMMESPREAKEAPYNPTKTDMTLKLLQRL